MINIHAGNTCQLMNDLIYALIAANALSLLALTHYYRKFKSALKKDGPPMQEALKLLIDGNALLKIQVIDPGDLFVRSRR